MTIIFTCLSMNDSKYESFLNCIRSVKPDVRVYESGGFILFVYNDPDETEDEEQATQDKLENCLEQQTEHYAVGWYNLANATEYHYDSLEDLSRDDTEKIKKLLYEPELREEGELK